MHDQNNVFYAIALSAVILITWQYFFATTCRRYRCAAAARTEGGSVSPLLMWINVGTLVWGALADGSSSQGG
jgi:hypothetical protein